MIKRYTFWLWIAVVFLFLSGAVHSISLFISPTGQNETERQLLALMMTYKQDMGAGFHPTMWNLFTTLSACFTFLCMLSGLTIAYLLKKKLASHILKGVVVIHLLVIGACFIMSAIFTFLPPIVLTGLCVLFLAIGLITIPSESASRRQEQLAGDEHG
jgi:hypothetical protein